MPKKKPNAWLIAGGVLLLFIVINLLSAHLRSDCGLPAVLGMSGCADDIRRAGFPWVFWESGGFAFHEYWSWPAFIADAGLAVAISALAGWLARRLIFRS
jgi:hypothetical protein